MFVIELDWMPTAIFEAKWQRDAELICRNWTNRHWEQFLVKGHLEVEFPPLIKLRLAHRDEIAAHAAEERGLRYSRGSARRLSETAWLASRLIAA